MILSRYFLLLVGCQLVSSENYGLDLNKRYATVPLFQCRAPLYYNCEDTVNCIHRLYVCDGQVDCPLKRDDESDCLEFPCPEDTLKCGDTGQCIPRSHVCNGCFDCPNGDDEKECPSRHVQCAGNQFFCKSQNVCIPLRWTCDGVTGQCGDDSDENCDISETEEIFLSPESPDTVISVNISRPAQDSTEDDPPILVKSWKVIASKGFYLYAKPLSVSLGSVCGPTLVEIFQKGEKAATLCGNSFPPWRTGHIANRDLDNGSYLIRFKFFNNFGDDDSRSFSLHLWQSDL